jgi:hypothetical protein
MPHLLSEQGKQSLIPADPAQEIVSVLPAAHS